jgi:hypothetical protein
VPRKKPTPDVQGMLREHQARAQRADSTVRTFERQMQKKFADFDTEPNENPTWETFYNEEVDTDG